jgi:outer membrane protein OmpA-like peptidoglycan-associated protein
MKIIFALFLTFCSLPMFGQSHAQEEQLKLEGDRYYSEEQYALAIQYYQELYRLSGQHAEIDFQLAESFRETFNYEEAEVYYLKAYYHNPLQNPLALYYYALMLKLTGEYEESIRFFSKFISDTELLGPLKDYVEQAIVDRAGSEMARTELLKNIPAPVEAETLNTSFNDYAPSLRDSTTLVITSGRVKSNREVIDERYGEAFTDNYYFVKNGGHWQDKTRQLFNITNTKYNDGSGCFNKKGDKYYFTICGRGGPQCQIYRTEFANNKWTDPVRLNDNINMPKHESRQPAVSKGGDTLLFSSNRPGGLGKYDIWMSINSGKENWGPAINLGNSVNTKLNELSPSFTTLPNVFFLASDGHQNYGGLDMYMVKRFSNGTLGLYNLDYPFNSNRDDCFINVTDRIIYFSSNREGGAGGFDIYSFPVSSVVSFVSKLSLKNKGARGDVKLNARTEQISNLDLLVARNEDKIEYESLTYEKKKLVDKMVQNQLNGIPNKLEYFGLTETEYAALLRISETEYKAQLLEKRFLKTYLTKISSKQTSSEEITITGILQDSLSGKVSGFSKILLMDESGEILKITTTNGSGKFRFTNVSPTNNLYLRLETLPGPSEKAKVENLTITRSDADQTFTFENIYFDFDHYNLRPEAKQVLNELAIFLKNSPLMQVEIYAYADDLGADDYNLVLTQRRGQSVLAYLSGQGVDQTSLAVIAKGRQKNPSTDVEVERQYNRRVEFYLNGEKAPTGQTAKTYILKTKSSWASIALACGVPEPKLKKLNGATSGDLQVFQPVRIPDEARAIPESLFYRIR